MSVLAHLSDIHFGDACPRRLGAALQAIAALQPDCVIVTGDITQAGRRHEFAEAARFFAHIDAPIVACPGNHDTPLWNMAERAFWPFRRFHRLGLRTGWRAADGRVAVAAFNTARGMQWRLDWSQGSYRGRLDDVERWLDGAAHRFVACHHPPETPPGAPVRSRPHGIERAWLQRPALARSTLLCGHLHGHFDFLARGGQGPRVLTAPSLASSRERGHGTGFLVHHISADRLRSVAHWFDGARGHFVPAAT